VHGKAATVEEPQSQADFSIDLIYPGASSHGRALATAMAKPRIKRGAGGAHARELDRHVGARMRARRIMLGLTQQQLAERIGIAHQQAYKYEKGINRMAASRLYKVGPALGVDVGYFFEGLRKAEELPSEATSQQRLLLEVAKNFMTLSPEHQQAICTIVRMLSEPAAVRRPGG
jgi:transcriptional regulator with XRE-family HTH domain